MIDAAVVGLGWWGRVLVESVQGTSDLIRFVRGVTQDAESDSDYAAQHGLVVTDDLSVVLRDPAVDAVVLATPHSLHPDQVVAAARMGKAVFCEKPLALNLSDAKRAVAACRDANVVLGLGTDKRFLPVVAQLTRLVEEGHLGEVLHVEAQYSNDNSSTELYGAWRDSEEETPGGGMTGPGLHALDALINLAGPIEVVDAHLHQPTPPPRPLDSVGALLRFRSGATGAVVSVRGVPDAFRIYVAGTKGWAEIRGFDTLVTATNGERPKTTTFESELAVRYLLERFADAIQGRAPFPVSTDSMLDTVAAFEATITSISEKRRVTVEAPTTW